MINAALSSDQVKDLVERRSRRAIALLLSYKEHNIDRYLPPPVQDALRKAILDEFNEFSSLVLDVVGFFEER